MQKRRGRVGQDSGTRHAVTGDVPLDCEKIYIKKSDHAAQL